MCSGADVDVKLSYEAGGGSNVLLRWQSSNPDIDIAGLYHTTPHQALTDWHDDKPSVPWVPSLLALIRPDIDIFQPGDNPQSPGSHIIRQLVVILHSQRQRLEMGNEIRATTLSEHSKCIRNEWRRRSVFGQEKPRKLWLGNIPSDPDLIIWGSLARAVINTSTRLLPPLLRATITRDRNFPLSG